MVDVVNNGRDTKNESISVVQKSEEHAIEKLRRNASVCEGQSDIASGDIRVVDIELRRDAFHSLKPVITSSDRIGDCPPPFIGSSTVDKYNQVSPSPVSSTLPDGYILAHGSRGLTMSTYMFRVSIKESRRRRHDPLIAKLV